MTQMHNEVEALPIVGVAVEKPSHAVFQMGRALSLSAAAGAIVSLLLSNVGEGYLEALPFMGLVVVLCARATEHRENERTAVLKELSSTAKIGLPSAVLFSGSIAAERHLLQQKTSTVAPVAIFIAVLSAIFCASFLIPLCLKRFCRPPASCPPSPLEGAVVSVGYTTMSA